MEVPELARRPFRPIWRPGVVRIELLVVELDDAVVLVPELAEAPLVRVDDLVAALPPVPPARAAADRGDRLIERKTSHRPVPR